VLATLVSECVERGTRRPSLNASGWCDGIRSAIDGDPLHRQGEGARLAGDVAGDDDLELARVRRREEQAGLRVTAAVVVFRDEIALLVEDPHDRIVVLVVLE